MVLHTFLRNNLLDLIFTVIIIHKKYFLRCSILFSKMKKKERRKMEPKKIPEEKYKLFKIHEIRNLIDEEGITKYVKVLAIFKEESKMSK